MQNLEEIDYHCNAANRMHETVVCPKHVHNKFLKGSIRGFYFSFTYFFHENIMQQTGGEKLSNFLRVKY